MGDTAPMLDNATQIRVLDLTRTGRRAVIFADLNVVGVCRSLPRREWQAAIDEAIAEWRAGLPLPATA